MTQKNDPASPGQEVAAALVLSGPMPSDFTLADLNEILLAMRDGLWAMDTFVSEAKRLHGHVETNDPRLPMRAVLQKFREHPVLMGLPAFALAHAVHRPATTASKATISQNDSIQKGAA